MGVAKRGDREVRLGEMFVECAEKTECPGFRFPRQTKAVKKNTTPKKKRTPENQRQPIGRILTPC
jgi:hypothetical protein